MTTSFSAVGVGIFLLYKSQKVSVAKCQPPFSQKYKEPCFINPVYGNKPKTPSTNFWNCDWDGKEDFFKDQHQNTSSSWVNPSLKGSRTLMFVSSFNKISLNCKNLKSQSALSAVEKFCDRIKLLDFTNFDKIVFSVEDNKYCEQTANQIYNNLSNTFFGSGISLVKNHFLSSCVPYICSPLSTDEINKLNIMQDKEFDINKLYIDKAGMDAAFYDIFYRPNPGQRTLEMYVCHPIVCSLMFCKALQLEPRRYFSFKQNQELSFLVLKINEEGHITCHSFSDLTFDRYQNED